MANNKVIKIEFYNENEEYCKFHFDDNSISINKDKYDEIILLFGKAIEVNNSYHEKKFTEVFCGAFPITYLQACKYNDLVRLINGEVSIGYICWVLDSLCDSWDKKNAITSA